MKPETMRTAFLVLFAVLTIIFVAVTWPFAKAAFLAFTLAIIFFPLHRFLLERLKFPRYLSSAITTLIVAVCVIIPLAVLAGVVATQVGHLFQSIVAQAEGGFLSDTIQPMLVSVHDWLERMTGSAPSLADLQSAFVTTFKEVGKKFYEFSPRVLTTTVSVTVNFLLMFMFLVVFFAEGGNLYNWLMETSPFSVEHRHELAKEVRVAITSSIGAHFAIAFVQGVLLGFGFWVAGFSQPLIWALVAAMLSLIPVIGAASCYLTAAAVLLTHGDTKGALLFLVFGFGIISTVDNVIRALLVRGTTRMHPVLLFVTLIGAIKLIGPVGLIVGPALLAIFLAVLRIYRREFAKID